MELDFKTFKSAYFEAKTNTTQFEKDCLERNSINGKIISIYHDDFNIFQKRREDRLNRKSIDNLIQIGGTNSKQIDQWMKCCSMKNKTIDR